MLKTMMSEPLALTTRAFTNPPSILTSTNKPEWRRMQQPAANGHGNARALAGFYSGLLQGRLLEDELLGQLAHEHAVGEDRTLLTRTRFGLGTMLDQPGVANATYGLGPGLRPPWGGWLDRLRRSRSATWLFLCQQRLGAVCADGSAGAAAGACRGECL